MKTLVLLRHAKSDWSSTLADHERPLAARGEHQAPLVGQWLARSGIALDLAIVSTARRAQQTWDLASTEIPLSPPTHSDPAAYTFSGRGLQDLIACLDDTLGADNDRGPSQSPDSVIIVGHNPAMEEAIAAISGEYVAMTTSCVAVLQSEGDWVTLSQRAALVAHGRPPQLT